MQAVLTACSCLLGNHYLGSAMHACLLRSFYPLSVAGWLPPVLCVFVSAQLGAALLLDSLVVDGEAATVDAIANAGGVEVLLLLVAGSRQGSQLRRTAASTLCDMAQVSPANEEVATAAVGVARMCN